MTSAMSEVLNQNEVDALLAAVDAGNVAQDEAEHVVASQPKPDGGHVEIQPYDFKRPERVSKDQIRSLESLHDGFSRNFGAALSGFLRTIMEVKVANIEQMTFSEFTHSLPNPTCFNLLRCSPLDGNMCLEISPLIIYPVIDRLLGGSNADLFIPQRAPTAIELRLVSKIIDRGLRALEEAWSAVIETQFELEDTESNPQLVQIVPPNEVVVVVGFELKMGSRVGTMSLCIPYNVIEPVMEKLSSQAWGAYNRSHNDPLLRRRVADQLDAATVTVTSVLAESTIKMSELRNLQVGDVVLTEKPASAPLTLAIEGKRKYIGHLGQFHDNRAFKVARTYRTKDRV